MPVDVVWRGYFDNPELNELHAEAFGTRVVAESEWNGKELTRVHSLGWVTAGSGSRLVGTSVVAAAVQGARTAGGEWPHVDFDSDRRPFYLGACGFTPTDAGPMRL